MGLIAPFTIEKGLIGPGTRKGHHSRNQAISHTHLPDMGAGCIDT